MLVQPMVGRTVFNPVGMWHDLRVAEVMSKLDFRVVMVLCPRCLYKCPIFHAHSHLNDSEVSYALSDLIELMKPEGNDFN